MEIIISDFYSIKKFAELLDIHPNTVRNAIKCGRIHAFRVGKGKTSMYRIPHTEIQRMAMIDFADIAKKLAKEIDDRT